MWFVHNSAEHFISTVKYKTLLITLFNQVCNKIKKELLPDVDILFSVI